MASGIKKIFDTGGHGKPASIGLLLARLFAGGLLFANHGLPKIMNYSTRVTTFDDPFRITAKTSLWVVLGAEGLAALVVVLGLGTRIAAVPLAVHTGISAIYLQLIQKKVALGAASVEVLFLYTGLFLLIALAGPGRVSLDHLITK